eukprot:s2767_g5.t1
MIADELEIKRLKDMGSLQRAMRLMKRFQKRLTRMVRTWHDKFIDGVHVWLRRSRYMARELAWLTPDRQDLFSPASSVLTVRLLPTLFMKWKTQGYVLSAVDIADAFLMVPHQELTVVTCELAAGDTMDFVWGRVLPGQRDGSQLWHESFRAFLGDELQICEFPAYPSLLRTKGDECLLLLHVDDVLRLSKKSFLEETLMPALKAKYKVACETISKVGAELTFLKRHHVMVSQDEMAIQSHPKLLVINRKLQPERTPGHPMLDEPDESAALCPANASVYRIEEQNAMKLGIKMLKQVGMSNFVDALHSGHAHIQVPQTIHHRQDCHEKPSIMRRKVRARAAITMGAITDQIDEAQNLLYSVSRVSLPATLALLGVDALAMH